MVKIPLKGEVRGHALKSHGNYIVDHGKSFCGNPDMYFCLMFCVDPHGLCANLSAICFYGLQGLPPVGNHINGVARTLKKLCTSSGDY